MKLTNFVLDVDGVLTDGSFHYSIYGKVMKVFGAHDADGLKLIRDRIAIQFISADKRGFEITKKRVYHDMGYPLTLVSEEDRFEFVKAVGFENTVFMGDGYYDAACLMAAKVGIAPANAWGNALRAADYVTSHRGGDGAVMEAALYVQKLLDSSE